MGTKSNGEIRYDSGYTQGVTDRLNATPEYIVTGQRFIDLRNPPSNHQTNFGNTVGGLEGTVSSDKPLPLGRIEDGRVVLLNGDSQTVRVHHPHLKATITSALKDLK